MKQGIRVAAVLLCSVAGWAWEAFEVSPAADIQQFPSVSGDVVVWQEYVYYEGGWDWDIYGVDLANDPFGLIVVASMSADQTKPSIWGTWVVWEDNLLGDADVWISDITDHQNVQNTLITPYENDQVLPRVHGNTMVWQHLYYDSATQESDWDIYAADITNPTSPIRYAVTAIEGDQQLPAVYRSRIVWQDNTYGDNDILSADVWRRNQLDLYSVSRVQIEQNHPVTDGKYVVWTEEVGDGNVHLYGAEVSDPERPVEFLISDAPGVKSSPAISGNIVVWQDNWAGNWDIYGFNLVTRQEFPIIDDAYNQTNPAIDGRLVAYEDDRYGNLSIFAVRLDGPLAAECPVPVTGDVDGDCRVDLNDLASIAANWLADELVY